MKLSKNSGSHAACTAGLAHARGACAVVMSCDLQDPPEILPALLDEWKKGHDIV